MKKRGEYNLDFSIDEIRPTYKYDVTCQGTVPVVIRCFLESESYEECVRKVFSLRGDVDTMACIAGGIAGAFYKETVKGEDDILEKFLDKYLFDLLFSNTY